MSLVQVQMANAIAYALVMWIVAVKQEREVNTDGGRVDERGERGEQDGWRREEGTSGENVVMAVQ